MNSSELIHFFSSLTHRFDYIGKPITIGVETYGRVHCAILGSRGLVAQRLLQRLLNHSWLTPVAVVGSPSSVGVNLREQEWYLDEERPELPDMVVKGLVDIENLIEELHDEGVQIIFSALPDNVAELVEEKLAFAGFIIISHALLHRLEPHVPLVIPDVNPSHLSLLKSQDYAAGKLISCSNCTVVPLALTVEPLHRSFPIESIHISTDQALSGGGRKLLAKGRIGEPISSEIPGEAESIEKELRRILGTNLHGRIVPAEFSVTAKCKRVARDHGHLARVEVKFLEEISAHEIIRVWRQYSSRTQELELPSSPNKPIIFVDGKLDIDMHRWVGSDTKCPSLDPLAAMSVAVGEVEVVGDTLLYTVVADNTIRGAAGYSVLLAELLLVEGILHDSNTILESEPSRLDQSKNE